MKTFDEFWEAYSYLTRNQAEDLWKGFVADRKETTQQAAQRALDWYDSPALYFGGNREETARETLYKSVLGEEW